MNNKGQNNPTSPTNHILNHYFKVLKREELPFFKRTAFIPSKNPGELNELWREHEHIRKNRKINPNVVNVLDGYEKPSFTFLDLKLSIADKLSGNCVFCERRCGINRHLETGFCNVKNTKIASEFVHRGEEAPLVPSHTIFFTGCTFKCVFCQNMDISQHVNEGMIYKEQQLAEIIDARRAAGSLNVNFVGGDPTPHLLYILKTIRFINENIPIIWNSNFYMSLEAMRLLDGVIDLYLSDFKYGNDECALRLSGIPDYWEVVTRNHKLAWKSGDMIIRHLVLPNHVECCTIPVLDWIYENLGKKAVINIMAQYRPLYGASDHQDISRFIYRDEYLKAINYARDLGFENLL